MRTPSRTFVGVVALFAVLLASTPLPAQDEAGFRAGLDKVHDLMKRGRWTDARDELRTLLAGHAGKDWALRARTEIEEDMKRCVFRVLFPAPDAKQLIKGKLLTWQEDSGKIKLAYTEEDLADFLGEPDSEFRRHPLTFAGSYTIELSGRAYPGFGPGVQVEVGIDNDTAYFVVFGHSPVARGSSESYMPAEIERHSGESRERLAYKEISPVKIGKPYTAKIRVTATAVEAYYNGRKILTAPRRKGDAYGGFGFFKTSFAQLTIEGDAQPSWLQGLVDKSMQEALARFEREWKPEKELPSWLLAEPKAVVASARSTLDDHPLPGRPSAAHERCLERLFELWDKVDLEAAAAYLDKLAPGALPECTRAWLTACTLAFLERWEESLPHCELVCMREPDYVPGRLLRAELLFGLGRREESDLEYDTLLADHPQVQEVYVDYALFLLHAGRLERARQIVAKGQQVAGVAAQLAPLAKMLTMAERGPDWPRTHEYRSKHYEIVSDIDRQVCIEASRILEEALTAYRVRLTKQGAKGDQRFRVFLFSGEAGYQAYASAILGEQKANTAGLYTPALKQLLIWNLPDREDMMRTVRHEGFHQFLDLVVADAPIWLNEGMAEFYETMRRVDGQLTGGQVRDDHLAMLRQTRDRMPIREFVRIPRRVFYANPGLHYAQAWATVHFLRNGAPEYRRAIDLLLDTLQEGKTAAAAVETAFAGIDWAKLQSDFDRYVTDLK